jgi:hypothetical protein
VGGLVVKVCLGLMDMREKVGGDDADRSM